jgi:hypothetical protein
MKSCSRSPVLCWLTETPQLRRRVLRHWLWILPAVRLLFSPRVSAENHADYKYEDYKEEGGRIHIRTHSALVAADLAPWLTVKGKYVYDGISGATPTGAPPLPGSDQVPTTKIQDIRRAYSLETPLKFGPHGFSPLVAWSRESDYESYGVAGTYSLELNQKNTVLSIGGSHDFDRVIASKGSYLVKSRDKDKTDVLVGLSQLLGPETVLTANLTLSYSEGFLADPYKGVNFFINYADPSFDPPQGSLVADRRPAHRFDQIAHVGLTHFVKRLNAGVEGSYRFYHNEYGVFSHTVSLSWLQKLGANIVLSPVFRFHHQSAADFYNAQFTGDPSFPNGIDWDAAGFPGVGVAPAFPGNYSADYRLSRLNSFTYGLGITWKIKDRISLDAAYKRYVMEGLDGVTSQSAYPSANVFTVGLRAWF